jgi:hypothetical protein
MGIAVVLIFYLIASLVAATIGSLVLATATFRYLKAAPVRRKRMTLCTAAFPFACVLYAGIWFIAYAAVNDVVFHHDPMLGDGWYTDIGDGYAIDMIDVMDQGTVHPVTGPNGGLNSQEGVSGVRRLQVVGSRIFGSQDLHGFEHLGQDSIEESAFFSIDTHTHGITNFATERDLASYAQQKGATLQLRPIADVYDSFRFTWFEPLAGLMLVIPPGCAFAALVRRIYSVKKQSATAVSTATESNGPDTASV